MSREYYSAKQFQFLEILGFSADEIKNQCEMRSSGCLKRVDDLRLSDGNYIQNLHYLQDKMDEDFILNMLFLYTDAFLAEPDYFIRDLDRVKAQIGDKYLYVLDADFWDTGESKVFELMMCNAYMNSKKWMDELDRLAEYARALHEAGEM